MKLYYANGACSLSIDIAHREAGLSVELEKVNLKEHKTESGEDFYEINPKGYVPAFKLDDGSVLTENPAILAYVADQGSVADLIPAAGTIERYRVEEWLGFISTEVHKNFSPLFGALPDEVRDNLSKKIVNRLAYMDTVLASRSYLNGETFTVADCYAFAVIRWSKGKGIEVPVHVAEYMDRIAARPHVQEALVFEGLTYP